MARILAIQQSYCRSTIRGGNVPKRVEVTDVFTPSDFPTYTYVARDDASLETSLKQAFLTPNEIVSVSGPSKSGKTVLIEAVVGPDFLIKISGASIRSSDELWDRALNWMQAPTEVIQSEGGALAATAEASAGGSLGIPLVAGGEISAGGSVTTTSSTGSAATQVRSGIQQVIHEIGDSDFVLFIDDFHYMSREVQIEVAKQIKEAAEGGVKICTASVPHRSDDVVRSNAELRGRVRSIDQDYWAVEDLVQIANLGFQELNIVVPGEVVETLATEASGSPQLMQILCLQLLFDLGTQYAYKSRTEFEVDDEFLANLLKQATTRADFSSLVRAMHAGPRSRGVERKLHNFIDGTRGDVYRSVLLAISQDPPLLTFDYDELLSRVTAVCTDPDGPRQQSIQSACKQLGAISKRLNEFSDVVDWDETEDVLEIVDPYLLFYIRQSGLVERLGDG